MNVDVEKSAKFGLQTEKCRHAREPPGSSCSASKCNASGGRACFEWCRIAIEKFDRSIDLLGASVNWAVAGQH